MPIYEYKCPSCNCKFERHKTMYESSSDDICPRCSSRAQRVVSRIGGVIFSGTGFYTTENRQNCEDTVKLENIPNSTVVSNDRTKDI